MVQNQDSYKYQVSVTTSMFGANGRALQIWFSGKLRLSLNTKCREISGDIVGHVEWRHLIKVAWKSLIVTENSQKTCVQHCACWLPNTRMCQSRQQTSLAPRLPNVDYVGSTLSQLGSNVPCYLGMLLLAQWWRSGLVWMLDQISKS